MYPRYKDTAGIFVGNNSLNKAKILFFLIIDGICVHYGL